MLDLEAMIAVARSQARARSLREGPRDAEKRCAFHQPLGGCLWSSWSWLLPARICCRRLPRRRQSRDGDWRLEDEAWRAGTDRLARVLVCGGLWWWWCGVGCGGVGGGVCGGVWCMCGVEVWCGVVLCGVVSDVWCVVCVCGELFLCDALFLLYCVLVWFVMPLVFVFVWL